MALFRPNAVVIVTGANGGIGQVIVQHLQELGATVVGCDMGEPAPRGFDVRDREGWRTLIDSVVAEHGRLDALINNAGVQAQGQDTVKDVDDDEWDRVMTVNINGARLGMAEAIRAFGDNGGRIINTASVAGYRHLPGSAVYSTSKAAVIAMTEQAALDYTPRGILINAIAPGMMENTMQNGKAGPLRTKVVESSLTGQPVRRDEIAATVEFLLDERVTSVVGTAIHIDAGFGLPKSPAS